LLIIQLLVYHQRDVTSDAIPKHDRKHKTYSSVRAYTHHTSSIFFANHARVLAYSILAYAHPRTVHKNKHVAAPRSLRHRRALGAGELVTCEA